MAKAATLTNIIRPPITEESASGATRPQIARKYAKGVCEKVQLKWLKMAVNCPLYDLTLHLCIEILKNPGETPGSQLDKIRPPISVPRAPRLFALIFNEPVQKSWERPSLSLNCVCCMGIPLCRPISVCICRPKTNGLTYNLPILRKLSMITLNIRN